MKANPKNRSGNISKATGKISDNILDRVSDAFTAFDSTWHYTYLNEKAAEWAGRKPEDLLGKRIWDEFPELVDGPFYKVCQQALQNQEVILLEEIRNKRWYAIRIYPSPDGLTIHSADITWHKEAEQRIRYLSRLYATLSQVNQTIVRVKNQSALFEGICNVAVEFGQFGLACICQPGPKERLKVVAAASRNIDDLRNSHKQRIGTDLANAAIHAGIVVISEAPSPQRRKSAEPRYQSSAAVPFRLRGEVVGALALYAVEADFFTQEEHKLLEEISLDISFALDTIQTEEERQQAEGRLYEQNVLLQEMSYMAHIGGWEFDVQSGAGTWTDEVARIHDMDPAQTTNVEIGLSVYQGESREKIEAALQKAIELGQPYELELEMVSVAGNHKWIRTIGHPVKEAGRVVKVHGTFQDITERKQAEENLRASEARERAHAKELETILDAVPDLVWIVHDPQGKNITGNRATAEFLHMPQDANLSTVVPEGPHHFTVWKDGQPLSAEELPTQRATHGVTVENFEEDVLFDDGTQRHLLGNASPLYDSQGNIRGAVAAFRDITEREQAKAQMEQQKELLQTIVDNIPVLISLIEKGDQVKWLNHEWQRLLGWSLEDMQDQNILEKLHPESADRERAIQARYTSDPPGDWYDLRTQTKSGQMLNISWANVALGNGASLRIGQDVTERKQTHEQVERQIQRLSALRDIDSIISSSFDLHITLDFLLAHVVDQLNVDAAVLLLFDPALYELNFAAQHGFHGNTITRHSLQLGQGYAGRAARERRLIYSTDLSQAGQPALLGEAMFEEGFTATYAAPLIMKAQLKGVLQVFQRAPFDADSEWLGFFQTLAGQAAIAVENYDLFVGLQRSNLELRVAYDATIEGWSRALDLRDKETEGHTQRVTEMTLKLASLMGMSESDLVHVRRGALLHDIGKLGVPDNILLKPSALTDQEWALMHKHPQYAYDMLAPISFLRPALAIPYCHHEKWDGSGYPRGLKGIEIPLSARIFALVDVWDALRSDRPYRPGWSTNEVLEYIRVNAGTHFDPQVVRLFIGSNLSRG